MHRRRLGLAAALACPALLVGPATLAAAAPSSPSVPPTAAPAAPAVDGSLYAAADRSGTVPVIVLLKSTVGTALPDSAPLHAQHAAALGRAQSSALATLSRSRAAKVHAYKSFDAVSATVDAAALRSLAADPTVARVVPDGTIPLADPTAASAQALAAAGGSAAAVAPQPGVCSTDPKQPQLNPEALAQTQTQSDDATAKTARSLGATGAGVKVAWFAEGIDVNNPDFVRADGSKVFTDYQDFTGEGTSAPTAAGEAFLDASSIAAQGRQVYDVSHYSALPLSTPCYIRVEGVAPGASMVALKVFGDTTFAFSSNFLDAIDYAVDTDHVDVLSQSFGGNPSPDTTNDVIRLADEAAVAAGVTVVASSGDAGVTNTIGSPASDPAVISAAATTSHGLFLQDGYGGGRFPGVTGYVSNNISSLSSGGVTQAGRTVDIAAPGELNWTVCTPDPAQYGDCLSLAGAPSDVMASGGTSESAPLVAGAAALVIEAYRSTHAGASPTPAQVKKALVSTADDIRAPGDQQGAGQLDSYRAVLAARSLPGTTGAQGETFVTDTGQIDAVAAPGTAVTRTVTVTNTGTAPQTVSLSGRTLGDYRRIARTSVTLSSSSPTRKDWQGFLDPVATTRFTVPAGVDRLQADIAYRAASTSLSARGRLTLVDPKGRLVSYSLPQGIANYGDVQVADPAPGTWTAYIYSRPAADGGSEGTYLFGAQVANYTSYGRVSPSSVTLAPGKSAPVTVTTTTSKTPGDRVASLVLSSNRGGAPTTIPVVLRSTASLTRAGTSFTGTLTGGNGRGTSTGQAATYQFHVAAGTPEINASVTLAKAGSPLFVSLVDPHGDQVAYGSDLVSTNVGAAPTVTRSGQAHALAPAAGTWRLVVLFAPAVAGTELQQPFTVRLDSTPVAATAKGLPQSPSAVLAAGSTTKASVTIHNSGLSPEAYFLDARSRTSETYPLQAAQQASLPATDEPVWLVPTDTTSVDPTLRSDVPVQFDFGPFFGAPDVESRAPGRTATGHYQADPVTQGYWFLGQSEVGPYGAVGAPKATATATMSVTTLGFARQVTSPTGDLWLASVDPTTRLAPVVVAPGQTVTVPVTVQSSGRAGTVVRGTVYVDALSAQTPAGEVPSADQVAAVPFSYTVG